MQIVAFHRNRFDPVFLAVNANTRHRQQIRYRLRQFAESVFEFQRQIGRFLKLVAPGVVENMALAALKEEVRPR